MDKSKLKKALAECTDSMIPGILWSTTGRCGKDNCGCHASNALHGPYTYVRVGEGKQAKNYYVPQKLHQKYLNGVKSWAKFKKAAMKIALQNEKGAHSQIRNIRKRRFFGT